MLGILKFHKNFGKNYHCLETYVARKIEVVVIFLAETRRRRDT